MSAVVGAALLLLAADMAVTARTRWAPRAVLAAGAASLAWELASLTYAALGELGPTVTALVVAQGLAFGGLGVLQLRAGRRAS